MLVLLLLLLTVGNAGQIQARDQMLSLVCNCLVLATILRVTKHHVLHQGTLVVRVGISVVALGHAQSYWVCLFVCLFVNKGDTRLV